MQLFVLGVCSPAAPILQVAFNLRTGGIGLNRSRHEGSTLVLDTPLLGSGLCPATGDKTFSWLGFPDHPSLE